MNYTVEDMTGIVGVPIDEAETTVQFSRNGSIMNICTSDNIVVTKLRRLLKAHPEAYTLTRISTDKDGNHVFYTLTAPKKLLTFRGPITSKDPDVFVASGRRLAALNAARKAMAESESATFDDID